MVESNALALTDYGGEMNGNGDSMHPEKCTDGTNISLIHFTQVRYVPPHLRGREGQSNGGGELLMHRVT